MPTDYKVLGHFATFKTLTAARKTAKTFANQLNETQKVIVRKDWGDWKTMALVPPSRKKNPTITTSTLPIGEWSPAHAIRRNADGSVDILREKNSGKRRANISEGFMAGGVFHPIRHSADYDASRVGEGRVYKKKRKKGTKPTATGRKYTPKKASTKRAMVTSRRDYGGDGSRYSNPGKKPTKAQVNAAWRKYDAYVKKSEKTGQYNELYANRLMLAAQLLQKEYQDFR